MRLKPARTDPDLAALSLEEWECLYARAVGAGCGGIVAVGDERLAAADELVAMSLTGLVRAGTLATLAAVSPGEESYSVALGRKAAAVVRLLDSALAAHGRQNGYDAAAWRELAATIACASGDELADEDADEPAPLIEALDRAAERIACVFVVLPRDRMGVPAHLAEAIGPMLLIYAACEPAPNSVTRPCT
jgi:hypothetical protein